MMKPYSTSNEYLSLKTRTNFVDFYEKYKMYMPFLIDIIERINRNELSEWDAKILIQYHGQSKNLIKKINLLEHDLDVLEIRRSCLEDGFSKGKIPGLD